LNLIDDQEISGELWQRLKVRLLLPVSAPRNPKRFSPRPLRLLVRDDKQFHGVFARISKDAGGNANVKGAIKITASSRGNNQAHQIIDCGWKGDWGTKNKENGWVKFDLINRRVEVTGYALLSIPSDKNYQQPQSWVI
jgi:hypothetical protein